MKRKFFGAAQTVTGSRILFEHHHYQCLIDCGLFQGPKELRLLNWNEQPDLLKAQAVLLTHVHIDHSGYLPRFCKMGFRGPIYCSQATADLLPILLMDAAKLQEEDARFANFTRYSKYDPALPLYDSSDVGQVLKQVVPIEWNTWTELQKGISFKFLRSGHILGSALTQISYVENDHSKIITFTGDLGGFSFPLLKDPEIIAHTDVLVTESTYGNRVLDRSHVEEDLAKIVNKVIGRQGTLVVPAFSVGRTQDLLWLFWRLKRDKKIPACPVYLDSPMAHKITEIYKKHSSELKYEKLGDEIDQALDTAVCCPILSADESMLLCMSDQPKIVISASGMLQGGRVLHHLRMKLPDEKNGVLFTGFQAGGTKGRLLKEGIRKLRIHHKEIDVEAEVFSIEGLSAHADQSELTLWLSKLTPPPEAAYINHGELEASRSLSEILSQKLKWPQVQIPEGPTSS